MKSLLAISISISSVLTFFCPAAQAQYDSFNPPLGFYIDYDCSSQDGLEELGITLFTVQGGLFLASGESEFPEFWASSQELGPVADYNEFGEPWAWEYRFTDSSLNKSLSYDIVLLDQWGSDDSEYLKVTQYPPEVDGAPRAPVVLNYVCEVIGGGVNPFL
ncbi:MAG: hypothetical protein AAGA83_02940 [Cyanobacteria bacterium P01_F01_bin.116]